MNILITGSNGFIGKNLKNYFEKKFKILSPKSKELNLLDELQVKMYFLTNKVDFIIHCATKGGVRDVKDEETTFEENLKMLENLIKYKNENTRIILFSSGAMYDKTKSLDKIKEKDLKSCSPKDLYGKSKKKICEIVQSRNDVTALVIFSCFGYEELKTRFPSYSILKNLKNEPIIINKNAKFDYIFIEDLEKIVEYFILNKPQNKIINVTPNSSIELKEIAKKVNEISSNKSEIIVKNEKLENSYSGDNSILLEEIPNFKFSKIEYGLKKLYNYIKLNINDLT